MNGYDYLYDQLLSNQGTAIVFSDLLLQKTRSSGHEGLAMRATLIVIQNDADHAQTKALVEKLMDSKDPSDQARMVAQAYLTEAYERSRWPRRAPPTQAHRR